MRSDKFEYTEKERAGLFGQFSSAMKIANDQKRPYGLIKQALQAIIADDSVVSITPKVISDNNGNKVFHVVGNYENAFEAMVAGQYKHHFGLTTFYDEIIIIPMAIQPVDRKVRISQPLGKIVSTQEIFDLYPKMADPMTLLTLGAKFPKEQLQGSIGVVWKDHTGQFWQANLSTEDGRERSVDIGRGHPEGQWHEFCRVLLCDDGTSLMVSQSNSADKNFGGLFLVTFDKALSFSDMVKAGKYVYVDPSIHEGTFPLVGRARTEEDLLMLRFDRPMNEKSVIDEMNNRGLRPATITHALAFGAQYPEEPREHPIVFLGSSGMDCNHSRIVPCLDVDTEGRKLVLNWIGNNWYTNCSFAAVRK